MVDRPTRPSAISPTAVGPSPLVDVEGDRISARLPTGETVEINLWGATVTSWKNVNGYENLWLSQAAVLDGSKPIRGGIPLVFPSFGPPNKDHVTGSLPQHGFARLSHWEYLGKSSSESDPRGSSSSSAKKNTVTAAGDYAVRLDFGLTPANIKPEFRKAWPFEFALQYSVTLGQEGLHTSLEVRNPGKEKFDFQFLAHTYFHVPDISKTTVTGLAGTEYVDKVLDATEHTATGNELRIEGTVDRVYKAVKQDTTSIVVDGKPGIDIVRENLADTVIWNPWKELTAGIQDWEPKDGYRQMVCVESGSVDGWQTLEAGDGWEGGQLLKSHL